MNGDNKLVINTETEKKPFTINFQAALTQELAERQKSCQTVMERLMQVITLSQQRHQSITPPILQQSVSSQKEFASSPGPPEYVSPMEVLVQRQHHVQQHQQASAGFERQNLDPRIQGVGDFPSHNYANQSPSTNDEYDPIKSLLNQLQDTNNEYPNRQASFSRFFF